MRDELSSRARSRSLRYMARGCWSTTPCSTLSTPLAPVATCGLGSTSSTTQGSTRRPSRTASRTDSSSGERTTTTTSSPSSNRKSGRSRSAEHQADLVGDFARPLLMLGRLSETDIDLDRRSDFHVLGTETVCASGSSTSSDCCSPRPTRDAISVTPQQLPARRSASAWSGPPDSSGATSSCWYAARARALWSTTRRSGVGVFYADVDLSTPEGYAYAAHDVNGRRSGRSGNLRGHRPLCHPGKSRRGADSPEAWPGLDLPRVIGGASPKAVSHPSPIRRRRRSRAAGDPLTTRSADPRCSRIRKDMVGTTPLVGWFVLATRTPPGAARRSSRTWMGTPRPSWCGRARRTPVDESVMVQDPG